MVRKGDFYRTKRLFKEVIIQTGLVAVSFISVAAVTDKAGGRNVIVITFMFSLEKTH